MKEFKIGEEIRIRCVEGGSCSNCIFHDYDCYDMHCTEDEREDKKDVHFEIVEG